MGTHTRESRHAVRSLAAISFLLTGCASLSAAQNPGQEPAPVTAPAQPQPVAPSAPPSPLPGGGQSGPSNQAAAAPVLPRDARQLVDDITGSLIRQLQSLYDQYISAQRPDDAAAVRKQIQLLRAAVGLPEDPALRADHVDMSNYRDRVGETFQFTVTGSADVPVWGTGIYTDDTPLEGAAVHAGVLRSGQTGPVRVTVLPPQQKHTGSRRHGMESFDSGPTGGSYGIETGPSGTSSRPTSLLNFRGRIGETVTLPVLGSTSGQVWGTDIYTDDSSLGAAAVHAGLVQPGEFGFATINILGGEAGYAGSVRHAVRSSDYGEWEGSFRIASAPKPWVLRVPGDVLDASGLVNLNALRNQPGVSFSLRVTGIRATVRGTGVYTDDTAIGAAAVHAGVLRIGESGYVKVTTKPGQASYVGSDQNNIKSADAGPWAGSFSVERGSSPER